MVSWDGGSCTPVETRNNQSRREDREEGKKERGRFPRGSPAELMILAVEKEILGAGRGGGTSAAAKARAPGCICEAEKAQMLVQLVKHCGLQFALPSPS